MNTIGKRLIEGLKRNENQISETDEFSKKKSKIIQINFVLHLYSSFIFLFITSNFAAKY